MSQRRPYGLRTALLGALTGVVLCGTASPVFAAPPPNSVKVAESRIAFVTPAAIAALPAFTVTLPLPNVAEAPLAVRLPPLTVLLPE